MSDEFESLGIGETEGGIPMELSVISPGEVKVAVATYYLADSVAFVGDRVHLPGREIRRVEGIG